MRKSLFVHFSWFASSVYFTGWLRTGDLAYYDENGEIFIVDRMKEVMIYHNHRVSPTEIEEVLGAHPDVMEAVVVPIPHEIDGERPMAFVKKRPYTHVNIKFFPFLSLLIF